jgi:ankyrin repeat protein
MNLCMPNELIEALRSGDLARVRKAIQSDPKEACRPNALCEAAGLAFQPALALLVKHGADLNAAWRGYRPLHNLIQTHPHDAGQKATSERLRCLDWMLEHGADAEQTGAWPPARAVIIAAFSGRPEFVKRLRKKGDPFAAAALADRKLVEATLRKRPDFARERDMGSLTALQCAAGSRMSGLLVDVARLLIDAGADIRAKTRSWSHDIDATYLSASAKNAALFELLLDRGADATEALTPALWNGTEEMAAMALAHGAVADRAVADTQPLLNNLVRWGRFQPAMWLLQQGASPNIPDERGWTAVHQAASRGNERMMQALLAAGGDITRRDKEGCVPRDRATRDKLLSLLARGAAAR